MKPRLHERNWYRFTWLLMRQSERSVAHYRRDLAHYRRLDCSQGLVASTGRLVATCIRCASSYRERLGL